MTTNIDMTAAIACANLTKIYQTGAIALNELTLTIERGMSFGLLGENGAGKSTLVRLVMGFLFPTSGVLRVLGESEVRRAHSRVGYLHERPYVELRFTGYRYLTYMAELSGLWGAMKRERVDAVLEQVDLSEAAPKRVATYSKGMLQRLSIAQALLTDPELLVLDEPTNGLDPYSQWKMRQIMGELRKQGKTLLICSHYLPEVETLCDTVGILQRGRLVQYGAVSKLLQAQHAVEIVLAEELVAKEVVTRLGIAEQVISMENNVLRIPAAVQSDVLAALVGAAISIHSLNPVSRTLEDVYISTTRPEKVSVQ
ncbi:MAG TPA: ABC transporter ATP-binding protein [Ktedonobacteraceae bacterium]|nr:ABC transporter ATP-binding protein [Ktedonobacteraceae bacterium]